MPHTHLFFVSDINRVGNVSFKQMPINQEQKLNKPFVKKLLIQTRTHFDKL